MDRNKRIFILGCGIMQVPALRIARDMGWKVFAADGNPEAEGIPLCDGFFHVDLKDTAGLVNTARAILTEGGLDGVFTAGTDFSLSVAKVAEALDLPGHSPEAALLATDKVAMRRRFRDAGVPSPAFTEVGPDDDPTVSAGEVPGPWVVKPVDSMGARGVVRIDDEGELAEALAAARGYSRSGRALLETYMEGPEYSLDALVENGRLIRCGLADRIIRHPPYFIETGHTIPSILDSRTADSIWDAFGKGVKALGLTLGAAKGDVKLTPSGPMIGEIAARLSGGYMSGWTWPAASGVEPVRGGLRLAAGLDAGDMAPVKNLVCAERAVIPIDGTVAGLEESPQLRSLPGVEEVFLRYSAGDKVSFPKNNVEKAGNIIVTGPDHGEADRRARAALREVSMVLDPKDDATGQYLDADLPFPPDALERPDDADDCFFSVLDDLWTHYPPRPSAGCGHSRPVIEGIPHRSPEDYAGRSAGDILAALEREGLVRITGGDYSSSGGQVQSDFWKALVRGGLAGARWYLER